MSRDPLWMEGNDLDDDKPDYDLNSVDDEEDDDDMYGYEHDDEDDGVDPDRLHDGFYDD